MEGKGHGGPTQPLHHHHVSSYPQPLPSILSFPADPPANPLHVHSCCPCPRRHRCALAPTPSMSISALHMNRKGGVGKRGPSGFRWGAVAYRCTMLGVPSKPTALSPSTSIMHVFPSKPASQIHHLTSSHSIPVIRAHSSVKGLGCAFGMRWCRGWMGETKSGRTSCAREKMFGRKDQRPGANRTSSGRKSRRRIPPLSLCRPH